MISPQLAERYELIRRLGSGGVGVVFLVRQRADGRLYALKLLHPELAHPEVLPRFRREARAVARLSHPGIVALRDAGTLDDGTAYLVMEYAEGASLRAALAGGPLPVPRALEVLEQLVDAVAHAHDRSVVHRDLTPSNIILVPGGVKVLDFGIAKILDADYADSVASSGRGVFGTPAYMAPEQIQRDPCDGRTDVYALGCVAFELVTGSPPFSGAAVDVMHLHVVQAPDRASARAPEAGIPPALDDVIDRCLAKRPDDRYATARALLAAIRAV